MNGRIVRLGDNPELFEQTLAHVLQEEWPDLQKHALNWRFQIASAEVELTNASVGYFEDENPVAISCAVQLGKTLSYFGQDIMVMLNPGVENPELIIDGILNEYLSMISERDLSDFNFTSGACCGRQLTSSKLALLKSGAMCTPRYYGIIDLNLTSAELKKDLRKSYKSLINFGKREIQTVADSGSTADRENFYRYQVLHERMVGRATRPQSSWDVMFEMISAEQAEIIYGFYGGELVGASYFPNSAGTTIYGSGAYDRTKFEKPLAHWPIFCAIKRAKARGNHSFNLGEVYLHDVKDDKQNNIAYFKKGFTSRVVKWDRWSLHKGK